MHQCKRTRYFRSTYHKELPKVKEWKIKGTVSREQAALNRTVSIRFTSISNNLLFEIDVKIEFRWNWRLFYDCLNCYLSLLYFYSATLGVQFYFLDELLILCFRCSNKEVT